MNKLTFALLLVGLCASACLARTSPQIRRPFKFTPGQTYIYEYRGRQWNGLAKLADQYSGLTIDCDVVLQALPEASGKEVVMKLNDVKVEQLHTQALDNNDIRKLNAGQEVNARQLALYKEELGKPIRFTYVDGKIVRFVAETREPEWSINIKKSILSLFQLDLAPTRIIKSPKREMSERLNGYNSEELIRDPSTEMPLVYPVYEESFGGICETQYELDSVDNIEKRQQADQIDFTDVLNVTKTVNYKNCLTDPSVSYDRHSFKVNTQTFKGKLFGQEPLTVAQANYYPLPGQFKAKYSNAYTAHDSQDNVASATPVQRHSYTKYNLTTVPESLVERRTTSQLPAGEMLVIEGIYSEGKIKYEADGDLIMSDTQQSLKLVSCTPTTELARVIPDASNIIMTASSVRQPSREYSTIQCELSNQKLKFYQALWKYAQLSSSVKSQQQQFANSQLYSHKMVLPFALSASWFPLVAGSATTDPATAAEFGLERSLNPEQLAKSFESILISLAEDVLSEDVAQSKRAGEKVIRLVNIVAFMPKDKLVQVYDRCVEHIQEAKKQQIKTRGQQAIVDNGEVAKWKIVRKLFLDSLPLAGSKQAIEMIELLIETNRVKSFEAKEMCEAVPANLRYPDTEIIDAFIRMSQLPQVRKSRSLFASCSIAVGKMIGQAYAKSQDASYKPTIGQENINKLPVHLREDELIKQVVEEADPRRQMPIDWSAQDNQEIYERLVLDEQDLTKYVMLYKQMLNKAGKFHEKVIYLETLAHMKVPQVLPILEPFVTGRLSLAQCLGTQPLDINRPVEQSQWYNFYGRNQQQQQQQQQRIVKNIEQQIASNQADQKDWSETESFGAEECNYMRTIAIYALAHVAHWSPNKVQTMLLPVFDNTYEPYQIRIAAFTTMMLTPVEEHVLERIASQMWREPSKEVASFVVGTIDTMSKMQSPAMSAWKHAAQKAADSMPKQYLDTWRHSWMAGGDHFNSQKQSGLNWVAEIIKSNVSSIPRAAYWRSGRFHGTDGTKYDNHFEFGFTSKGLESLLKNYIAYNKQQSQQQQGGDIESINIVASIIENLYDAKDDIVKHYYEARDQIKGSILNNQAAKLANKDDSNQQSGSFVENFFFKRQQPIDGVNSHAGKQARQASDLFEGANSRTKRSTITLEARRSQDDDEEAKLTFFSKVFDSTSYHALDKKQLIELIEKADDYVKSMGEELIMGGKLHYVKMIMPSNMWHVVPSQLGLPIVVTHRTPIIASIKIDGAKNGQLTSNKLSQLVRQQVLGGAGAQQVPHTFGQNFATMDGLNITAQVHPKIMYSNYRFMFAVDQAQSEAYGVQTEKSHQVSLPMEVSVAYSQAKQLVSFSVEPKTTSRVAWKKEAAKTFIGQLSLGGATTTTTSQTSDMWLGQEHLIRVPSQQSQYQRLQRSELFVPSLLGGLKSLINEPREQQQKRIDELETPYKFEHRAIQQLLGLEFFLEGATDDEDIVRAMSKPELVDRKSFGQLQWSSTNEIDDLDQHSKSGPFGKYLHLIDSAMTRPTKYLECYTTMKPATTVISNGPNTLSSGTKSPVYRLDFILNNKESGNKQQAAIKINQIFKQQQQQQQYEQMVGESSRRPINFGQSRIDARTMEMIEMNKKINNINGQYATRQNLVEAY